jgi:hypothetical protein
MSSEMTAGKRTYLYPVMHNAVLSAVGRGKISGRCEVELAQPHRDAWVGNRFSGAGVLPNRFSASVLMEPRRSGRRGGSPASGPQRLPARAHHPNRHRRGAGAPASGARSDGLTSTKIGSRGCSGTPTLSLRPRSRSSISRTGSLSRARWTSRLPACRTLAPEARSARIATSWTTDGGGVAS